MISASVLGKSFARTNLRKRSPRSRHIVEKLRIILMQRCHCCQVLFESVFVALNICPSALIILELVLILINTHRAGLLVQAGIIDKTRDVFAEVRMLEQLAELFHGI